MKKIVHEVENEGFLALLGEKVIIYAYRYIYEGVLAGVNDTCIQLTGTRIVYDTGGHNSGKKDWDVVHPMWNDVWYIQTAAIESFGKSPK